MKRREFVLLSAASIAASACGTRTRGSGSAVRIATSPPLDAAAFRATRRMADTRFGRIAYVERGSGEAALFLHGAPLNGFQWRGALDRLAAHRRCVAPDFMGLGYTQVGAGESLAAGAQADMLAALLDSLGIASADIVASDSGGAAAQLFLARYPGRVRTLLLTNCDVEPDSPSPKVMPAIQMAQRGTLAEATAKWLTDTALARSTFGAAVYRDPASLAAETIEYYVSPLVGTPLRRAQYHEFHTAMIPNPLAGIEASLRASTVPVRMVWGAADDIFPLADAEYLDRVFPNSRGIRRVAGGKLFFPEEYPDVIADEARRLWGA